MLVETSKYGARMIPWLSILMVVECFSAPPTPDEPPITYPVTGLKSALNLDVSPDGNKLLVTGTAKMWLYDLAAKEAAVQSFSADAPCGKSRFYTSPTLVFCPGYSRQGKQSSFLWNTAEAKTVAKFDWNAEVPDFRSYDIQGDKIAWIATIGRELRSRVTLRRLNDAPPIKVFDVPIGTSENVSCLALSRDARRVAIIQGAGPEKAYVYDCSTASMLWEISNKTHESRGADGPFCYDAVFVNQDKTLVISGSPSIHGGPAREQYYWSIYAFDVASGRELWGNRNKEYQRGYGTDNLVSSPTDNLVAAAVMDGSYHSNTVKKFQSAILLLDTTSGNEVGRIELSTDVRSMAFSPDGNWLYGLVDNGKCIQAWNLSFTLRAFSRPVR